MGDSVTFGWGVTFDESYPGATLQAARRRCDHAGVPAPPDHMGNWIEARAAVLSPTSSSSRPDPTTRAQTPMVTTSGATQATATGAKVGLLPPISTFDAMGNSNRAAELQRVREIAARCRAGRSPCSSLPMRFAPLAAPATSWNNSRAGRWFESLKTSL